MPDTNNNPNQEPIVKASLNAPQGTPLDTGSLGSPDVSSTDAIDASTLSGGSSNTFTDPQYPSPYPVASLSSAFGLTAPQQAAQDTSTQIQGLNQQESNKAADTISLYKQQGFNTTTDANGNIVPDAGTADLTAKLTALQNEAQAIPLQVQNDFSGRAATQGAVSTVSNADTRNNAIQALEVSSLIAAKNGSLTTAQHYVEAALTQKYGPIEAQIKALTANLQLIINSPQYSNADKQQAQAQLDVQNQRAAQLDIAKQNYTNGQNEVLKYAGVASSDQLQQLQSAAANGPAAVTAAAAQLGLTQPQSGRYTQTTSTLTDAFGNQYQVQHIFDTVLGKYVTDTGGKSVDQLNASSPDVGPYTAPSGGSNGSTTATSQNNLAFQQYGLLSKTSFDPNNTVDQLAQRYLDAYIKQGSIPTASVLGRNLKPGAMAQIDSRARQLYQQATGQPLPNPEIIKGYQQQLIGNNNLLNNLKLQEGTINANADLLLKNLNGSNLNQAAPIINGIIDNIKNALGDPNVATYLAQNTTVSNELGSLLALKNASGTTVHDKLEAAGIINKSDNASQIAAKVKILLQEAVNAHDAIQSASADLYKQTDPLLQDSNNPGRQQSQNAQFVEQALTAQGLHYDALVQEMQAKTPPGTQPALDAKTGKPGFATPQEIQAGSAIPL